MNYYKHTCKCGCNGQIEIKEYHKWYGIPLYINGHNKNRLGCNLSEESKQRIGEASANRKHTWESKQKTSLANKGKNKSEEHKYKIAEANKGKKHTNETKQILREKNQNYNNPMYGKKSPFYGKQHSEETKQIMSELKKGKNNPMYDIHRFGEYSPNWSGGKSFEPYGIEFNKELKDFIKNRDFNICQTPNCMNTENLDCHHIDYNKQNNNIENLITLCKSCHTKTNGKNKREFWINYYQEILNVYL